MAQEKVESKPDLGALSEAQCVNKRQEERETRL